jgi:hypothetical protein
MQFTPTKWTSVATGRALASVGALTAAVGLGAIIVGAALFVGLARDFD